MCVTMQEHSQRAVLDARVEHARLSSECVYHLHAGVASPEHAGARARRGKQLAEKDLKIAAAAGGEGNAAGGEGETGESADSHRPHRV